jgi:hypothetical protein
MSLKIMRPLKYENIRVMVDLQNKGQDLFFDIKTLVRVFLWV